MRGNSHLGTDSLDASLDVVLNGGTGHVEQISDLLVGPPETVNEGNTHPLPLGQSLQSTRQCGLDIGQAQILGHWEPRRLQSATRLRSRLPYAIQETRRVLHPYDLIEPFPSDSHRLGEGLLAPFQSVRRDERACQPGTQMLDENIKVIDRHTPIDLRASLLYHTLRISFPPTNVVALEKP
jgi:hypothetical protein